MVSNTREVFNFAAFDERRAIFRGKVVGNVLDIAGILGAIPGSRHCGGRGSKTLKNKLYRVLPRNFESSSLVATKTKDSNLSAMRSRVESLADIVYLSSKPPTYDTINPSHHGSESIEWYFL